jgi:pyruvate,water dikinase
MTAQLTDFPIPEDLPPGFWNWDRVHCPHPTVPLEQELMLDATAAGFSRSMEAMGSVLGVTSRLVNYYSYLTFVPLDLPMDEDLEARKQRYEENVIALMPVVAERWQNEWLPAMMPSLERATSTDFSKLSDADLLARFLEMKSEVIDRWAVHGLINYSFFAAGRFADFYREVVAPEDKNEGYEVLQGFPSIALESSRGLWQLSRIARNTPRVRALFESTPPGELFAALQAEPAAAEFLSAYDAYIERFGWRGDSAYELTKPSWKEDPGLALSAISGYITIGDEAGPDSQYDKAVARREELLAAARSKLAAEPEKLARFEELYTAAKPFTPISEDHNHWIDQMGDIVMRYPALELGRRLTDRGLLAAPEDVFYLYTPEIGAGIDAGEDMTVIAQERRAERERWARIVPPPAIGAPPPPSGDPIEDVLIRFFGVPVEPSTDASVIKGVAASPGTVSGTAKVLKDLSESGKLKPGDIMVCEMTLPPWTPLFSTAAAVVADSGGILSHCAIVAREYRIPCVVGTAIGTQVLADGMQLTVDGSRGIVRIDSR